MRKLAGLIIAIPYIAAIPLVLVALIIVFPIAVWDGLVHYNETGEWRWY